MRESIDVNAANAIEALKAGKKVYCGDPAHPYVLSKRKDMPSVGKDWDTDELRIEPLYHMDM